MTAEKYILDTNILYILGNANAKNTNLKDKILANLTNRDVYISEWSIVEILTALKEADIKQSIMNFILEHNCPIIPIVGEFNFFAVLNDFYISNNINVVFLKQKGLDVYKIETKNPYVFVLKECDYSKISEVKIKCESKYLRVFVLIYHAFLFKTF